MRACVSVCVRVAGVSGGGGERHATKTHNLNFESFIKSDNEIAPAKTKELALAAPESDALFDKIDQHIVSFYS